MANQLKLEVLLQAIDKVTQPIKAMTQGNKELARTFRATQEKLRELNKVQENIDGFRKLSKDMGLTSQQFKSAQEHVRTLAQQMNQIPQPTAAMSRAFQVAKQAAGDLKLRSSALHSHLNTMRERLDAAGVSTHHLAQHQRDLKSQILSTNQVLAQQQARLQLSGSQQQAIQVARARYDKGMQQRNQMLSGGTSMLGAGMAMGMPVFKMIKDFVGYEDAMTGIARQIPGARDEAGKLTETYRDMSEAIKQLSETVPIPTTQLVDMTTAAARMNVGAELFEQAEQVQRAGDKIAAASKQKAGIDELMGFNRTVAMMSVAFTANPDEIAEDMGKISKNYKIPITQISRFADVINILDDKDIGKSNQIIDVLNRISGVISLVNMSAKDAAALSSTLLTLSETPETAGTAINAIVQKFAAAEKGTKRFQEALKATGLTAQAVQKGMTIDATGTLFKIFDAIKTLPSDKQSGINFELVGQNHSDTLAKLVSKSDELRRQINIANSEEAQGSIKREFLSKLDTLSSRWQILQNKIFNRSAEGGETLREPLISLMDKIGKIVDQFHDWTKANPELAATVIKTTAILAGTVTVMGGLTLALAALFGPFIMFRLVMTTIGIKGGILISVFRGIGAILGSLPALFTTLMSTGLRAVSALGQGLLLLSRFLIAHPLVAAISALAFGAIWVWNNWSSLGQKLNTLWNTITSGANHAWAALKNTTSELWYSIKTKVDALWATIKAQFSGITHYFGNELPAVFTGFGKNILNGLANGITQALGPVKTAITGVAEQVINWFKEKLGIHSPSRVFAQLGQFTMLGLDQGLTDTQNEVFMTMQRFTKKLTAAGVFALGSAAMMHALPAAALINSHAANVAAIVIDKRPTLKTNASRIGDSIQNGANHAASIGAVTINIHTQAGQDAQAIAREVSRQLEKIQHQAAARQRSQLMDNY